MAFTAMLALAGCMNMDAEVNIEGDDSARGAVEVTVDSALLQGASLDEVLATQLDTQQLQALTGDDWNYTQVDHGDTVGLRFETVDSMNFVQLQDAFQRFELPVSLNTTEDGYSFSMPGNAPATTEAGGGTATMTVTFPGAVTSASDTGVVEGHSVSFNLIQGAETYHATGAQNHALFYSIVFGGALLVLTLIIVLALSPKAVKENARH